MKKRCGAHAKASILANAEHSSFREFVNVHKIINVHAELQTSMQRSSDISCFSWPSAESIQAQGSRLCSDCSHIQAQC
eukprot:5624587-Pleurochrysis_carterae.AAC.3